jgi:hypothetical protein
MLMNELHHRDYFVRRARGEREIAASCENNAGLAHVRFADAYDRHVAALDGESMVAPQR